MPTHVQECNRNWAASVAIDRTMEAGSNERARQRRGGKRLECEGGKWTFVSFVRVLYS